MLGPGRYLLGAVELIWLVGFAWLGAARVRRRWLPEVGGEAGFLASAVVAIALLIWVAELLGTVSAFKPVPYLLVRWRCWAWSCGVRSLRGWRADGGPPPRAGAAEHGGGVGATGPAAGRAPVPLSPPSSPW